MTPARSLISGAPAPMYRLLTALAAMALVATAVAPAVSAAHTPVPFSIFGTAAPPEGAGATVVAINHAEPNEHNPRKTTTAASDGGWLIDIGEWGTTSTIHLWINGTGDYADYNWSGTVNVNKDENPDGYNDTGTQTLTLPPAPNLSVTSDGITLSATPVAGQTVTVTVAVQNGGDAAADGATLELTAGATRLDTANLGTIAAGGSATEEFTWNIPDGTSGSVDLVATLTNVAPAEHSGNAADNTATKAVTVTDYEVSLAVPGAAAKTTGPGAAATYSVEVTNDGSASDTFDLAVSEPGDGWAAVVDPATLALDSGASEFTTVTVTPPEGAVESAYDKAVTLTATSSSQAVETATATLTTTVDNLPVVKAVRTTPADHVKAGEVTVEVEFSKAMSTEDPVAVSFGPTGGDLAAHAVTGDFASGTLWTGAATVTDATGDGQHTFRVSGGTDTSGLDLVAFEGAPFTVDTVAPTTTDDAPAAWQSGDVTVTFTVTDANPGATHYTTDGSEPTTASPTGDTVTLTSEGAHTIKYFHVDAAGNVEAAVNTAANAVRIDTSAPATEAAAAGTAGDNGWYTGPVTVTLTATDPVSGGVSSGVATVHYRVGATGAFTEVTGGEATVDLATDGEHAVEYYAVDAAGNQGAIETLPVNIDTTAPTATGNAAGDGGDNGWHTGPVTVSLTGADSLSGVAAIWFRVGASGDFAEATADGVVLNDDGTHVVEFYAVDAAGNHGTTESLTVAIDQAAPATTHAVSGTVGRDGWYVSDVSISLTATDATSGVATTEHRLDGGEWNTNVGAVDVTGDGDHTLEYRSVDNAGNPEASKTVALSIDTADPESAAPLLTGTLGANGWYVTPVAVALDASDATSGVAGQWYALDGGALMPYTEPFMVDTDGVHTIAYNASDTAGNHEAAGILEVKVDQAPPTITVEGDAPATVAQFATTTLALRVEDASVRSVAATVTSPAGAQRVLTAADGDGDGVYEATLGPFATAGEWSVVAEARDHAGFSNATTTLALTVTDGVRPTVAITNPLTRRVSGAVDVAAAAADNVAVATVTFHVDGAPAATDADAPYGFTWDTAGLENGAHTVSANATDGAGNWRNVTRTVTVANAPTISDVSMTPAPDASAPQPVAGETITVTAIVTTATAPVTTTLVYSTDGGATTTEVSPTVTGDTHTFDLGDAFSGGQVIHYAIHATDAAGVTARHPAGSGFDAIPVFHPIDLASWTTAHSGGAGGTIDHKWADIADSRVEVIGDTALFGMRMEAPFAYDAFALYIVEFDTHGDGAADYNLTANYTVGETPAVWTQTWNAEGVGATATQPEVLRITEDATGTIILAVDVNDLFAVTGEPDALTVRFRTIGSTDASDPVPVDAVKPAIAVATPTDLTDGEDATITATVTDAGALASVTLYYRVNDDAYTQAAAPTVTGDTHEWTLPAADLAQGTLSYFVSARDAAGNTATTGVATAAVADTTDPTATIDASAAADQGAAVEFRAANPAADVVSFEWDFGDGATATGAEATHVFDAPGAHTVTLTLTDDSGNTATLSHAITVADVVAPTVAWSDIVNGAFVQAENAALAVTAADAGGVATVEVSTDDGATWTPAAASGDAYEAVWDRTGLAGDVGVFVLHARATDGAGNTATAPILTVVVDGVAPTASAGSDVAKKTGVSIAFSAAGSGDNVAVSEYLWDFGDGNGPVSGESVTHAFATAGTYTVTLTVVDVAGNTAQDTLTATITRPAASTGGGSSGSGGSDAAPSAPADTTPPTVLEVAPTGTVDTARPAIVARYSDDGAIHFTGTRLLLDGEPVDATVATSGATYTPQGDLAPGEHTVTLEVEDAAGNRVTRTWTFTVPEGVGAPADGAADVGDSGPAGDGNATGDPVVDDVTDGADDAVDGVDDATDGTDDATGGDATDDPSGDDDAAEVENREQPGFTPFALLAAVGAALALLRRRD